MHFDFDIVSVILSILKGVNVQYRMNGGGTHNTVISGHGTRYSPIIQTQYN